MEAGTTTTNLTARLPILNPADYDLWLMRIEQYSLMIDYSLWEVIKNGSASSSQNPQNVAFVSNSTNNTNSTNKADNTAYEVSTGHTQENLEQLHPDDLEEMDLQWEMAMLTIKARSYQAKEEHPTNYALMAFTSSGSSSSSDSERSINVLKLEVRLRDNALDEYKIKLDKAEKERDQLKQTLEKFQNSSKSLNDLLESQVIDKFKTGLGYNATFSAVEGFVNLSDKSGLDKGYHSVPPTYNREFHTSQT
ncbi:hypothetical protein Tco_0313078 [Tanacetum coccineum]